MSSLSIHSAAHDPEISLYQINLLADEIKYTSEISSSFFWTTYRSPIVQLMARQSRQLYWTLARLFGNGQGYQLRPPLPADCIECETHPRILIDVTDTYRQNLHTGIQRVVREIARASIATGQATPVVIEDGRLLSCFRHPDVSDSVTIYPGDRYVILDAGFSLSGEYLRVIKNVAEHGGQVIICVYDIIPLLYPGVFPTAISEAMLHWFRQSLHHCDTIVTISKSVAEDFIAFARNNALPIKPSLRVGWFPLGADFAAPRKGSPSRRVGAICARPSLFLSVGTLEPRKNHATVIAACELFWKAGIDISYVIIGRCGWMVRALRHRILTHPEFGRRLFWIESADDHDLAHLYQHAEALIQPSIAEGFGLPIIEAAHFGTPVIASDIPVFREVGGEALTYFDPMDADALARCMRDAMSQPRVGPAIASMNWKEATARLIALVRDETYPFRIENPQNAAVIEGGVAEANRNDVDAPFQTFQIKSLLRELEHVQASNTEIVWKLCELPFVRFLNQQVQQLIWTLGRLGGRDKPPPPRPFLARDRVVWSPGPRVLIDVTLTYRKDWKTGVQRVVREIAKAAIANGDGLPVIIENGRLLSYFRHPDLPDVVEIGVNDRFLVLDGGWCLPEEYLPILAEVSRRGGRNILCVYDLIPLLYPGVTTAEMTQAFRHWLAAALPYCDAVVAISRSVAEDFLRYTEDNALACPPALRVGWFHLGADFPVVEECAASPAVQELCGKTPFFITVGTVEPRKNHVTALAAFDLLWAAGLDIRYVIVGKVGWLTQALAERIRQHPEFGRRLVWLDKADDGDLSALYRSATASIQPSIAEGFGLPLVEAAHFGTPVIASDIRVFHEVGGDRTTYFDPMDPEDLARCIRAALKAPRVAPSIPPLGWKEATARLMSLIKTEAYSYTLAEYCGAAQGSSSESQ